MSEPAQSPSILSSERITAKTWGMAAAIVAVVVLVFSRLFDAGFSGLDDDIHVYANPYLNPPTLQSVAMFWTMPYRGLYVPLAYTFFAIIAHFSQLPETFMPSMGQVVTVGPAHFHAVNIFVDAANAVMAFTFLRRLAKNEIAAFVCALLFALHPLQVESVGWVAELRGLSGSFFGLFALNLFLWARGLNKPNSPQEIAILVCTGIALILGMLCKPSIVALPLVTLAIDRIVFGTNWRRSLVVAVLWLACTSPFLAITHSIQSIDADGRSLVWQRPFVAGDALAFYLGKILLPINLCIDYGRTPQAVFSHAWAFFTWIVPAALLWVAFRFRKQRPLTFLGALVFVLFLLPVLGLVPFAYQNYSTVSDRYAYLSLLGIALILLETIEHTNVKIGASVVAALSIVCAGISFYQSQFWLSERAFLYHCLAVNPNAAFAYNNLGEVDLGNKNYFVALTEFQKSIEIAPGHANTLINEADCYAALGETATAKNVLKQTLPLPKTADNWSDMGNVLIEIGDTKHGLQALDIAYGYSPTKPSVVFNYAKALASAGKFSDAQPMFERSIQLAPSLPGPRVGLGVVFAQTGHLPDAAAQFAAALRLDPTNSEALANYNQAERILTRQQSGRAR